jgi:kynurenine formamidase
VSEITGLQQRYYDLSNPIWEGMPFFPASFPAEIEQVSSVDQQGANVHKMTIATHHGTHVDAPRHYFNDGTTLEELSLHKFMGEGVVLDLTFKPIGSGIGAADLEKYASLVHERDIVILFTGCSEHLGEPGIDAKYTYLDGTGAEWLLAKKVKSVGIDFFSIDQYGDRSSPAHNALLGNGIPLIEEISAEARKLAGHRIYLICLPLKVMAGDGAPARVIAYPME